MRERWVRFRSRLAAATLLRLSHWFARASWSTVQRRGRVLGRLYWSLSGRDRRRTLEHLEIAFPEMTAPERRDLGRRSAQHLGTNLGELLHLLDAECDRIAPHVEIEGLEHLEALQQADQPIVLVTGHCGNWELLGTALSCQGLPISGVVRQVKYPELGAIIDGFRARFGLAVPRGGPGASRRLLRSLKDRRILIMLIDQDIRADGVFVPFFGRLAYTPAGAAQIALRFKAAVVPAFDERLKDGSHRLHIDPPLVLPDDATAATAVMTTAIERQIRRRPEQWVWIHRRWRRRPPEESDQRAVGGGTGSA